MASTTMTALRQINPIASTAAILPHHRLAFNVPGTPFVEPSWASVEPVLLPVIPVPVVHGVLYKLTENDFETVCQTEGVPFGYRLHRCRVIPYHGNDECAGQEAFMSLSSSSTSTSSTKSISAFTLRAGQRNWRESQVDIPPSQSYLNVLIRGAKEFHMDRDYVQSLERIPVGRTLIGNGLAERMLQAAELQQQQRQGK